MTTLDRDQLAAQLDQRQADQLAAGARRRACTAATRAELQRRRAAGKAAPHRARLAWVEQRLAEARRDGVDDSWWEEPDPPSTEEE